MSAIHHTMANNGKPYDTRLEYIESSGAAYFDLRDYFAENFVSFGNTDVWKVRIGLEPQPSGDKKMFGQSYTFGLAVFYGKWRPSFYQDWPTNVQVYHSSNPIIDYIAATNYVEIKSIDGMSLYRNTSGRVNLNRGSWHFTVGSFTGDGNTILAPGSCCTHQIYSFSREKDGKLAFDFIPCIKDGVVGMYEDISGVFYSSQTSTPFIAGPKI